MDSKTGRTRVFLGVAECPRVVGMTLNPVSISWKITIERVIYRVGEDSTYMRLLPVKKTTVFMSALPLKTLRPCWGGSLQEGFGAST